eukprot:scaffold308051_cov35-Attheya_sp.AAC.2
MEESSKNDRAQRNQKERRILRSFLWAQSKCNVWDLEERGKRMIAALGREQDSIEDEDEDEEDMVSESKDKKHTVNTQEHSASTPQTGRQEPPPPATNLSNKVLSHIMPNLTNWMKKSFYPPKKQVEESQQSHEYQESQEFAEANDHIFLDNRTDLMTEFSNGKGHFQCQKMT